MSMLFGDTLSRETVESRQNPNSMGTFNRYQVPTSMCRKCRVEFQNYKGMKQGPMKGIGYCKEHNPKAST